MPDTLRHAAIYPHTRPGRRSLLRLGVTGRIAAAYLVAGLVWVWASDLALALAGTQTEPGFWLSAGKGTLFVLLSAAGLYWLARRELRDVARASALLSAVADGTTDAVFVKDRSGKYLLFNGAAARFVGKPVADVLGRDDTELFDAASARLIMDRDREVMGAGLAETKQEVLTSAGATRTYMAMKAPFRDERGNVIGVIGISRDVTDLTRASEALREQEAFVRGILDSMNAHIAVIDPLGRIVAVNEAWRAFGSANPVRPGSMPVADPGADYLDACDQSAAHGCAEAAAAAEGIRAVIAGTRGRFTFEYPCHSGDEERWFFMSVTRLAHHTGGVVVAHANVTERVRAEARLRASERRYRELADALPQIVWTAGPDGGLIDLNAKATELTGVGSGELTGWSWDRVIHPDDLARTTEQWTEILRTGRPRDIEFRVRCASGEYRRHITRQVPARDAAGAVAMWYGTSTDIEDLKRAEDALRDERTLLRTIIDSIPDLIFTKDTAGRFVLGNRALLDFIGVPDEAELVGKTSLDLRPDEGTSEAHASIARRVLHGEAVPDREARARDATGREGWRLVTKAPLRDHTGTIIGMVVISRDIQKSKEREQLLAESQARLSLALAAARMGVWEWDVATDAVYWSPECLEIVRQELPARTLREFTAAVVPGDAERVLETARSAAAEREAYSVEFRVRCADGSVRWLANHARGEHTANGRTARVIGTVQDITDRKRAEEALRDSESRFRGAFEHTNVAMVLTDLDNRFVRVNEAFARLFGYTQAEMLALSMGDITHPDHLSDSYAFREALLSGETDFFEMEKRYVRKDGELLWGLTNVSLVRDAQGRPHYYFGQVQNVTVRKRAEEALAAQAQASATRAAVAVAVARPADLRSILGECCEILVRDFGAALARVWTLEPAGDVLELQSSAGLHTHTDDAHRFIPVGRFEVGRIAQEQRPHLTNAVADDPQIPDPSWAARERLVSFAGYPLLVEGRLVGVLALLSRAPLSESAFGHLAGVADLVAQCIDRKRAEGDRDRQGRELQLIFDTVPALIFYKDLDHRLVRVNRELVRLVGAPEADLLGRTDAERGSPHAAQYARDEDEVAATGRPLMGILEPLATATGVRWLQTDKLPHRDENGRIVGVVGFAVDITERQKAEQALRDRERLLGIVTGSARVGLVVVNDRYEYLFANEAYADFFGLTASDVIGRRISDLLAPVWDQIRPRLDQALGGERVTFEQLVPPGPVAPWPRWFRAMYGPRAGDTGEPTAVLVVLEVTEQKRAEAAIRESEERYRRLVDVLPAAVFIHTETEIVFCNPACVRLLGAEETGDLLGRNPFDFAHPGHHAQIRARIGDMTASGRAVGAIEMRVVRLDGRTVPVYSVSTPLSYGGRPAYLIALSDLTERERSMALLRSVLGSVNDPILTIDDRGTVRSANPATERVFGYAESELVGGNIRALMPEPYRGEHDGYLANYARTGVAKVIGIGREVEGRRKDGTTFPLELTVTEFKLDGARHFTGVIRDITARKRLEAQFQQAQKMEAVGRLAGGVAHDFNNLLTVINGYGDLVLMDLPADSPLRESVASIRDAGERAARLTQQLLAFSRKAMIVPKVLDLNELASESAKLLRRLIGEDVTLAVVPDPALTRIKADPGQLEQVIMNLVVNARDAMPTGGRLTIATRNVTIGPADLPNYPDLKPGRYAQLSVADTGQGMSDEVKGKIFEPFFTTKEVGKGTGLGLAVVHGVVKQCEGHIGVESAPGAGTTFRLLFPVVPGEDAPPAAEVARLAARGTETVLLVEDEGAVRTLARIALEVQGFRVLEADSGEKAIRLCREHPGPIHVLVTDVVMPQMGGRQVADAVRAHRPALRVLYMSGYTDDAIAHHGVADSTDAFLQKPFTPLALARQVRQIIDQP